MLVGRDVEAPLEGPNLIRVADPYAAFAQVLASMYPRARPAAGVHPRAVGADDRSLAPLTERLARRAFPTSGQYTSAGLNPATSYDPSLSVLEDELQLDLGGPNPTRLAPLAAYPAEYHVIVALNLDYSQLPEIPFHSALQRWTVDVPEGDAPKADLVRELNAKLTDLMEMLRGDSAS